MLLVHGGEDVVLYLGHFVVQFRCLLYYLLVCDSIGGPRAMSICRGQ